MIVQPIHYDMPLYRPPSEGRNLIIQLTLGCSFNRCTFCSMYREKQFTERPLDAVFADIDSAARLNPDTRRIFLADGDALVVDTDNLLKVLNYLHKSFPKLSRVSSYALPANLIQKSTEELKLIREAGLSLLYYGLESGNAQLLKIIRKGAQPALMIEGLNKATEAGMKISATVILGLGGQQMAEEHINDTALLVNQTDLTFLSTLQLHLDPAIEAEFVQRFDGQFMMQDDYGMLTEQIEFIQRINPSSAVIFRSNHASNALPLAGNLPKDKARLLAEIQSAYDGDVPLVPKWYRSL